MSNLAATADRLRVVKDACVDFLILYSVDAMMTEVLTGDRLWVDIQGSGRKTEFYDSTFSKFGRRMDD